MSCTTDPPSFEDSLSLNVLPPPQHWDYRCALKHAVFTQALGVRMSQSEVLEISTYELGDAVIQPVTVYNKYELWLTITPATRKSRNKNQSY